MKNKIKVFLADNPLAYGFAKAAWTVLTPLPRLRDWRRERFRLRCYAEFEAGSRQVALDFAGCHAVYEAISPKNYWHLKVGSQHEDLFMAPIFEQFVVPGAVIFDIGGHTGLWTMLFARRVGDRGRVVVFEPESEGNRAIGRNAELNSLGNITLLKAAVSDQDGEAEFYVRPDKDTHSLYQRTMAPSPTGLQLTEKVRVLAVDSAVASGELPQPDFVKVDVEGHELGVLAGMKATAAGVKAVLVEVHHEALALLGHADGEAAVGRALAEIGFPVVRRLDDCHVIGTRT